VTTAAPPALEPLLLVGQLNAATSTSHSFTTAAPVPEGALLLVAVWAASASAVPTVTAGGQPLPELPTGAQLRVFAGPSPGLPAAATIAVALSVSSAVNVAAVAVPHDWEPPQVLTVATGTAPPGGSVAGSLAGRGTLVAIGQQGVSAVSAWSAPFARVGLVTSGNGAGYFQVGTAQPAAGQLAEAAWTSASGGWTAVMIGIPWQAPPPPPPLLAEPLIPVWWDGLGLNAGWLNETVMIVEHVEGWYGDSPELNGHNVTRALADGVAFGPKILGPREVTITGAAAGPRWELMELRDQLAVRAFAREPAELSVDDPDTGTLTADVRADSETFGHEWIAGRRAFRWRVTLTAADPRLWGRWREVTLTTTTGTPTGRVYPRVYPWAYQASVLGMQATLDNPGTAPAPVFALFTGRLQDPALSDGRGMIRLVEILEGVQVLVNTETLAAEALGGATRASMIRPNSQPLMIPPRSSATWTLYGTQGGNVRLSWRPAWE
jgi:hypothetical protein